MKQIIGGILIILISLLFLWAFLHLPITERSTFYIVGYVLTLIIGITQVVLGGVSQHESK